MLPAGRNPRGADGRHGLRADLGQIEPRVLAVVSGDHALAVAAGEDDMYAPVAPLLGVDRATAETAVLGAMYRATTGHLAQALRRLQAAYPVAMEAQQAAARQDLRTYGGRLVRMGPGAAGREAEPEAHGAMVAGGITAGTR